jgi:hypothetical protein
MDMLRNVDRWSTLASLEPYGGAAAESSGDGNAEKAGGSVELATAPDSGVPATQCGGCGDGLACIECDSAAMAVLQLRPGPLEGEGMAPMLGDATR